MKQSIATCLICTVLGLLAPNHAVSQAQATLRSQLLGHWRLISSEQMREGEPGVMTLGPEPAGMITYTADGHMLAQLGPSARPKVRAAEATAAQVKDLLRTQTSYFGTFTVDEERRVVTHHRDGTHVPGERDFVRTIELSGNRLVLVTPTVVVDGKKRFTRITWERLPPAAVSAPYTAAARAQVAGTWELVEHTTTMANGEVQRNFGSTPRGLFIFGPDGYTTVQIVNPDRPLTVLDEASDDDARALMRTYLAYFGTFDVDPASRTIVIHTTADLNPLNSGADQIRFYELEGDLMYLQPPPADVPGGQQVSRITWRRVR